MATASDPNIYINTTQYRISFCTWFHYNLPKPCAKGNTVHLPNRQEMGSRHIAVQAFLSVCDDTVMLDWWIPDEDWVRQIRESGEDDRCSITNLNTGLAKKMFVAKQSCHSTRYNKIFFNKKKVQISKTKATKKTISFYYALSAGKPAPTVPSDQGFYQPLWDDLERSNRSLKRTAPSLASKVSPTPLPPTKKAKASPDPPNNLPLPPSSPESFLEANRMVQEAWKGTFPSLRFPIEMIGLFPTTKSPLVAAPHEIHQEPPASTRQPTVDSNTMMTEWSLLSEWFLLLCSLKKSLDTATGWTRQKKIL